MRKLNFGVYILTILALSPTPAQAYLDPGTGGMTIQMIIGAIAGIWVALKMCWHKITAFINYLKKLHPINNFKLPIP